MEAAIIKNCICTLCKLKEPFRPLGSSSKLLIPERFWIEATLGTRHFNCLCMKIWCFKGQLKSFNFHCLEFNQISILFKYVQLFNSSIYITFSSTNLFSDVQCTISLLLSTRTQLHQQDAIVSPCGLQNHSRWIPVGDSIEIELRNLWHNKLQVIWVCQRNLEDWWRFFRDLSGAKRDQWYLINYEYFPVLSELSRHSKVPAE